MGKTEPGGSEARRSGDETAPTSDILGRALLRTSEAPLRSGNHLKLLENGPATFDDWLEAIGRAEKWVHLEHYIFQADGIGRRFAAALSEKAREGVPVRVLYDWFGSLTVPRSFWRDLRRSGVEVRAVNPPRPRGPLGALERDHRKLVAVDGSYASVGGVCIGDGWLERSPETGLPYRDTAVGIRGPAAADAERAFARVWDRSGAELPREERPDVDDISSAGDVEARLVIQEPGEARVLRVLGLLMAGVRERVWITDAYFLSVPLLTRAITSAARDGVDVRVLLPATNDLPWIGALSRAGYRPLLESGIRIFEYAGPMIHAKTHVIDSHFSRIGSTNLNVSSLWANWEADLLVEDHAFGEQMSAVFENDLEGAREVLLRRAPKRLPADLGGPGRERPFPERPVTRIERRAGRRAGRGSLPGSLPSGGGSGATASRLGGEALRNLADSGLASSGLAGDASSLRASERKVAGALYAGALGLSVLAARYPRLLAWPLAATGGLVGGVGLLGLVRRAATERTRDEPEPGTGSTP